MAISSGIKNIGGSTRTISHLHTQDYVALADQPNMSSRSLDGKIFSGLCTAGFCLGTTVVVGIGEWALIKYRDENIDDFNTNDFIFSL